MFLHIHLPDMGEFRGNFILRGATVVVVFTFLIGCIPYFPDSSAADQDILLSRAPLSILVEGLSACDANIQLLVQVKKMHVLGDQIDVVPRIKTAIQKILAKQKIPTPFFVDNSSKRQIEPNLDPPLYLLAYAKFSLDEESQRSLQNTVDIFSDMKDFCPMVSSVTQAIGDHLESPENKVFFDILSLIHRSIFRYFVAGLDPHSNTIESSEYLYNKQGFQDFVQRDLDDNILRVFSGNPYYFFPKDPKNPKKNIFSEWIAESSVLKIEINQFDQADGDLGSSADLFREEYEKHAKEKDISGVVIDLRKNRGGRTSAMAQVADLFLKSGITIQMREKTEKIEKTDSGWILEQQKASAGNELPNIDSIPVIVWVSRYTASAAEMFTASLKENNAAVIIGEKTFGKGTGQDSINAHFSENNGLLNSVLGITHHYTFTPSGHPIQRNGIEPDITVKDLEYFFRLRSQDEQDYQTAYEALRWSHALPTPDFPLNPDFHVEPNPSVDQLKEKLKIYFSARQNNATMNDLVFALAKP